MKNSIKIFVLALLLFPVLTIGANAGSNWLNNLFDTIKTSDENSKSGDPSMNEIGKAFKEALRIGSKNVVKQLSNFDGFNADPAIHIPLPDKLKSVQNVLDKVGMSKFTDDLELKLNRAAEAATKKAKDLFLQSISEMTFDDVMKIYEGPKDSATNYFKEKMSPALSKDMRPIVQNTLSQVGAVRSYDNVMDKYKSLPFVPDVKANLTDHVVEKGMDGIFYYIAKEETAIRENPMRHTTSLLKKVFGK